MQASTTSSVHVFRPQLLRRRARLQAAAGSISTADLSSLISEIDSALQRIDNGTYGLCETCHESIEADRLESNPLVRFCLDHLSEPELRAHEQDLELATRIQAKLLPPRGIAVEGWDTYYRYEPAGPVGGDYCELIVSQDDQSLFFAVGDVSGKGVAASLLMTHLSAILRSLLSLELPLDDIVLRANRLFCEGTTAAQYATLVCGRATQSRVEICNAGHCRPLLLRQHTTERIEPTGLPLGLFPGAQYTVASIGVTAGDILALYSDGVTETSDPEGNQFGESRLGNALRERRDHPTDAIGAGVLRDITAFRRHQAPSDDVTLLLLRPRGA